MSETGVVEKLVRIEAGGIETYLKPSAVVVIKLRLFGCDVHLASSEGRKETKIFIQLEPTSTCSSPRKVCRATLR